MFDFNRMPKFCFHSKKKHDVGSGTLSKSMVLRSSLLQYSGSEWSGVPELIFSPP